MVRTIKVILTKYTHMQVTTAILGLVGPLGGYAAGAGWISKDQLAALIAFIPGAVVFVYAIINASEGAQIETALKAAPATVINQAIEQKPDAAISAVAKMDNVDAIITDSRTARVVPDDNVMTSQQSKDSGR